LVSTEPWASSTASETMFSEAISSISPCWRASSLSMARASSGSVSATLLVKNFGKSGRDVAALMGPSPGKERKGLAWPWLYHVAMRDSKAGGIGLAAWGSPRCEWVPRRAAVSKAVRVPRWCPILSRQSRDPPRYGPEWARGEEGSQSGQPAAWRWRRGGRGGELAAEFCQGKALHLLAG